MTSSGETTQHAPSELAAWWQAIRPRTLGASLVPVGVGLAIAYRSTTIDLAVALATLAAALLLQIAANLANDYGDCERGVDTAQRLGPTRVTQAGLLDARTVKRGTQTVLAAALLAGTFLAYSAGWPIVLLGAASIVVAVAYSAGPWPLALYGLGEMLAFVFFGPVAVCGTVFLQLGTVGSEALFASLPVACLVTALMVVNNLRDIPTDRATGKRTLAVRIGPTGTRVQHTALVSFAFLSLSLPAAVVTAGALLPLLATPWAVAEIRGVWKRDGRALNLSLTGTARLHLVCGALLVIGLSL